MDIYTYIYTMDIYTMGINCKKEWIWVSAKEVDELRGYYTEWSKSEK